MDFKDLFTHQQKILELELAVARARFQHLGLRELEVPLILEKNGDLRVAGGTLRYS